MCLDAAAQELGFEPDASRRRDEERGPSWRSSRPRGRDGTSAGVPRPRRLIEMAFHPRERSPWRRRMSRREMLRLMAGTAVAGGLLVGCGSGSAPSSASRVVIGTGNTLSSSLFDDNPMIESGLEPEKGRCACTTGRTISTRACSRTSRRSSVSRSSSRLQLRGGDHAKLRTGKVDFDVFVPTAEIIPKFVAGEAASAPEPRLPAQPEEERLADARRSLLRQWVALHRPLHRLPDRDRMANGQVSADIAAMDNPWEAFWDPEYKGIAGLYDEYRETIGVGMYRDGITEINGANPDDLKAAQNNLIELTDLVDIRYTIDGACSSCPKVSSASTRHGQATCSTRLLHAKGDDPSVLRYVWPPKAQGRAGGYVSNDNLAVLNGAENPVLAHMFLNYMLDDKVAIKNFSWNAYQPPMRLEATSSSRTGRSSRTSSAVVQSDFDTGQTPQLTPDEDKRWLEAWSRVQQGG